ncbi:hypothetical protein HanRHA438_Chr05g0245851 [Helianthus annuus]|nr:hypothetical protein HanRHA438_Chr05g0245851 [Helianthus annuus]
MFVHLTKRTEFLVCVCLFNKQTNFPPNSSRTVRQTFGSFAALNQTYQQPHSPSTQKIPNFT